MLSLSSLYQFSLCQALRQHLYAKISQAQESSCQAILLMLLIFIIGFHLPLLVPSPTSKVPLPMGPPPLFYIFLPRFRDFGISKKVKVRNLAPTAAQARQRRRLKAKIKSSLLSVAFYPLCIYNKGMKNERCAHTQATEEIEVLHLEGIVVKQMGCVCKRCDVDERPKGTPLFYFEETNRRMAAIQKALA